MPVKVEVREKRCRTLEELHKWQIIHLSLCAEESALVGSDGERLFVAEYSV